MQPFSRRLNFQLTLILAGSLFCGSTSRGIAEPYRRHAVVSHQVDASEVGREVLRGGGNAVDAAIATAFALAVTHPSAGNLGGGGFLVAYDAASKKVITIDFREMSPRLASPKMYLGKDGKLTPGHRAGSKAAGVPGTVRGLALAHRRLGRSKWADLVSPAARLAREGFTVSSSLAESLNSQLFDAAPVGPQVREERLDPDRLAHFPESVAVYRKPDKTRWQEGDRLIQPDLAGTLARIAEKGSDEFYVGETARLIVAHSSRTGGLITRDDLATYRAIERPPIHGTFRGFDIYGMGPPSAGGILIVQMLNILERYNLRADGPKSPITIHRVTEAMRRGFYTRATAIADPDQTNIPVELLTSRPYADTLARSFTDRATSSIDLASFRIDQREGSETTHLSTIDADGNAVALTYTLEEGYGCKSVVAGAGFLLNNEMGDFNLVPGRTDLSGRIGTVPNLIAPRKRMLSSQSPTIVLSNGRVRLVTGSPGGRTIPNTTLWVILNVLEFGLTPSDAVDSSRTHHQWIPDVLMLEGKDWEAKTVADLRSRGHRISISHSQGEAHSIVVDLASRAIYAVPDLRGKSSLAAGD